MGISCTPRCSVDVKVRGTDRLGHSNPSDLRWMTLFYLRSPFVSVSRPLLTSNPRFVVASTYPINIPWGPEPRGSERQMPDVLASHHYHRTEGFLGSLTAVPHCLPRRRWSHKITLFSQPTSILRRRTLGYSAQALLPRRDGAWSLIYTA